MPVSQTVRQIADESIREIERSIRQKARSKLLYGRRAIFGSACAVIVLTVVGIFLRSTLILAIAGYTTILVLLCIFTLASLISAAFTFVHRHSPLSIFRNPTSAILNAAAVTRCILVSASQWIADFYVSLCSEGNLRHLFATVPKNLALTFFTMTIGLLAGAMGQDSPILKKSSRAIAIYGYFFFFANLGILSFAMLSDAAFRASVRLFEWPLWLFDPQSHEFVRSGLGKWNIITPISFIPILLMLLIVWGLAFAQKLWDDAEDFSGAMTAFIVFSILASF